MLSVKIIKEENIDSSDQEGKEKQIKPWQKSLMQPESGKD
jgi:hypothetical protein